MFIDQPSVTLCQLLRISSELRFQRVHTHTRDTGVLAAAVVLRRQEVDMVQELLDGLIAIIMVVVVLLLVVVLMIQLLVLMVFLELMEEAAVAAVAVLVVI
tara:strand:- start:306 stop:608 length:303 start_codon:yes stop_codon:yes gene_type:complete